MHNMNLEMLPKGSAKRLSILARNGQGRTVQPAAQLGFFSPSLDDDDEREMQAELEGFGQGEFPHEPDRQKRKRPALLPKTPDSEGLEAQFTQMKEAVETRARVAEQAIQAQANQERERARLEEAHRERLELQIKTQTMQAAAAAAAAAMAAAAQAEQATKANAANEAILLFLQCQARK